MHELDQEFVSHRHGALTSKTNGRMRTSVSLTTGRSPKNQSHTDMAEVGNRAFFTLMSLHAHLHSV